MKECTHWSGQGIEEREREGKGECESSEVNVLLRCKWTRRGSLILLSEHTITKELLHSKVITSLHQNKGKGNQSILTRAHTSYSGDSERIKLSYKEVNYGLYT